ncbi:conserved hypothetical protein [Ricinus communis]|uniref:Uncharacterized protein n=1 Tax=Ricinus communis TaxID=3988 RepID=B9RH63_RICCO|nr:conserved hypothetical protein [Ricinus communis]
MALISRILTVRVRSWTGHARKTLPGGGAAKRKWRNRGRAVDRIDSYGLRV